MSDVQLYLGDCLEVLPSIPAHSIDMILCDLPYGTTACAWDVVIPFATLWEEYRRVIKRGSPAVLFGTQPFTTDLIQSNRQWFRYLWVWDKRLAGGFLNANRMPLKVTEDIAVFAETACTYNPQMVRRGAVRSKGSNKGNSGDGTNTYGKCGPSVTRSNTYYPTNLIEFTNGDRTRDDAGLHPTQKPVPLLSYLIRTYTSEGETVLDNCMGSGSTGVACVKTGRNFIGVEKDPAYFAIAERRIKEAQQQTMLPFEVPDNTPHPLPGVGVRP